MAFRPVLMLNPDRVGVIILDTKIPVRVENSNKKAITAKDITDGHYIVLPNSFRYSGSRRNEKYVKGCIRFDDVREPLRSCLYSHKSDKSTRVKTGLIIRTEPKYLTTLACSVVDAQTGEISDAEYLTDDQKRGNKRKIDKLNTFCNYYQPMYEKRQVSMFLLTFTEADQAIQRKEWARMIEDVKRALKKLGYPVRGYIWTMEISTDNYHFHYHLCIAIDRMNLKGKQIPTELKFEHIWNRRTQIQFVKKNIRNYLSQYFAKNRWRLSDEDGKVFRNYGMSNKLI